MRRAGNDVRVNVQLVDATDGRPALGRALRRQPRRHLRRPGQVRPGHRRRAGAESLAGRGAGDRPRADQQHRRARGVPEGLGAHAAVHDRRECCRQSPISAGDRAGSRLRESLRRVGAGPLSVLCLGVEHSRRHDAVPDLRDGVGLPGRGEAAPVLARARRGRSDQPVRRAPRRRLHRRGAGDRARPQRSRGPHRHGVGHDPHRQAAERRSNSCARRCGSTPATPSHYALARGLALFSSGALDRGGARARGSAGAQPDRDRAGTAARGDLRPPRAKAGGARHAPEVEAGREPGGAERHTARLSLTPTDGRPTARRRSTG